MDTLKAIWEEVSTDKAVVTAIGALLIAVLVAALRGTKNVFDE